MATFSEEETEGELLAEVNSEVRASEEEEALQAKLFDLFERVGNQDEKNGSLGRFLLQKKVESHFSAYEKSKLVALINKLASRRRMFFYNYVEPLDSNEDRDYRGPNSSQLEYQLVNEEEAAKFRKLTNDEMMVYQCCEKGKTSGMWIKDIKSATNVPTASLNKALKKLESEKLVKSVRSVSSKSKKYFMLYNATPDKEIVGGPWYHEQEFDHAFVDAICDFIQRTMVRMIKSKPQEYKVMENRLLWFALKLAKVTDVDLQLQDIDSILDIMVYDGRLERASPATLKDQWNDEEKSAFRQDLGYPEALDEKESVGMIIANCDKGGGTILDHGDNKEYIDGKVKKRKRGNGQGKEDKQALPRESVFAVRLSRPYSSQGVYMTQMPCGVCPLITQCHDGGVISPTTCVYMTEWLEIDQGHVKTDVVNDPKDVFHRMRSESMQW